MDPPVIPPPLIPPIPPVSPPSFDEIVAGLTESARSARVGPGLDPETRIGPLVSAEQLERVTGYIASGRDEGAELVVGGGDGNGAEANGGYFVEPTVIEEALERLGEALPVIEEKARLEDKARVDA